VGVTSLAVSAVLVFGMAMTRNRAATVAFSALCLGIMDLMLPVAWAVCLDVGANHAGVVTGVMNTAGQFGGFVCTVLFGYLVRAAGSYHAPLFVIAGMLATSAALFSRIDPTRPLVAMEQEDDNPDSRPAALGIPVVPDALEGNQAPR
jgi:MFS family permease